MLTAPDTCASIPGPVIWMLGSLHDAGATDTGVTVATTATVGCCVGAIVAVATDSGVLVGVADGVNVACSSVGIGKVCVGVGEAYCSRLMFGRRY